MSLFSDGRYRYFLYLDDPASVKFRVSATDYSGLTTTSAVYSIASGVITDGVIPIDPLLILGVAGVVVAVVVVVVVIYWFRRRSSSK